jgi:hypothetical protein
MSLSKPSMARLLLQGADERKWIGGAPKIGNYWRVVGYADSNNPVLQ